MTLGTSVLWCASFHCFSQSCFSFLKDISLLCLFSFYSYDAHIGSAPPSPSCPIFFSTDHCLQDTNVLYYFQIPKPNRELLLTPYPLKLLSFLCSLSYSGCNCPHGASISSALISSSALPSMVVATSPDQSCSFYDVQPSPHTIPLPPLTSEQSSRHIYVFKHSTETIFYAGYFNPIHAQTGDTNSELSPELLSLDNFVCTYGIQFTSLSNYHPCFHPPNLFTATVHVFHKSLFSAFLTF